MMLKSHPIRLFAMQRLPLEIHPIPNPFALIRQFLHTKAHTLEYPKVI